MRPRGEEPHEVVALHIARHLLGPFEDLDEDVTPAGRECQLQADRPSTSKRTFDKGL